MFPLYFLIISVSIYQTHPKTTSRSHCAHLHISRLAMLIFFKKNPSLNSVQSDLYKYVSLQSNPNVLCPKTVHKMLCLGRRLGFIPNLPFLRS